MAGKFKDLVGSRFSRLLVKSRAENDVRGGARWHCLCDCGNESIVLSADLNSGNTKSCGCLLMEYSSSPGLKGAVDAPRRRGTGAIEIPLSRSDSMYTTLWAREKKKQDPNVHIRYRARRKPAVLLRSAKQRAKQKGLEFSITEKDIHIPMICPIFKTPLSWERNYDLNCVPSIDRINPTQGYVPENIWVISRRANMIKSNSTPDELELIATTVRQVQ